MKRANMKSKLLLNYVICGIIKHATTTRHGILRVLQKASLIRIGYWYQENVSTVWKDQWAYRLRVFYTTFLTRKVKHSEFFSVKIDTCTSFTITKRCYSTLNLMHSDSILIYKKFSFLLLISLCILSGFCFFSFHIFISDVQIFRWRFAAGRTLHHFALNENINLNLTYFVS
jgi:hypothetical protein